MKLAALAAVAALALQADAKPVAGGGSFNAAPILAPGRYRDTILADEYLYWGVRVGAGQQMTVTIDTELSDSEMRQRDVWTLEGNVHTPTRGIDILNELGPERSIPNSANAPIQMQTPQVSELEDSSTDGDWTGPGVFYVGLGATTLSDQPQRGEVPLQIEIRIDGTERKIVPAQTPTPTPATTAAPAAAAEEDDPGPEPSVAAVFGVGGLLIGVVLAIVRRRPRR